MFGCSGVATLSCTDCSTSSSGTSDITDPGSPYSTASTHSSASEGSDDCSPRKNAAVSATLSLPAPPYCGVVTPPVQSRHWATSAPSCKTVSAMAPNTQQHCWPWGGKERDKGPPPPPPPLAVTATPLTPVTANVIANLPLKSLKRQTAITSHKTASAPFAATKRLKADHHSSNNISVKVTSHCATQCANKSKCCCSADSKSHEGDAPPPTKVPQQGKITEYFKSQVKPLNGIKKELAVKSGSGVQQGRKEPKSCETAPSANKYFPSLLSGTKSPVRNVPLSKASDVKRDTIPVGGSSQPWAKSSIDGKTSKVSQKVAADKKTGGMVAAVAARKMSSSAVSKFLDTKRNGLNIPSTSSSSSQKLTALLSPNTAQKSPSLSLVESSQKSASATTASATLKTALSSETAFKTGKEAVPKPKTIASEPDCVASSLCDEPTPILSVPTTIRFPAIPSDSSSTSSGSSGVVPPKPNSSQLESPDTIACRWSECGTRFDTSTGLLEHLQVSPLDYRQMRRLSEHARKF